MFHVKNLISAKDTDLHHFTQTYDKKNLAFPER